MTLTPSDVVKYRNKGLTYKQIADIYRCNKSLPWKSEKKGMEIKLNTKSRYLAREPFPIWKYIENPHETAKIAVLTVQKEFEQDLFFEVYDSILEFMFFFRWRKLSEVSNPEGFLMKSLIRQARFYAMKQTNTLSLKNVSYSGVMR